MRFLPNGMKRAMSALRIATTGALPGFDRGVTHRFPIYSEVDMAGREGIVAGFGERVVGFKQTDSSIVFNYFVNPERVVTANTGTGAATIDTSRLKLSASGGTGVGEVSSRLPIANRAGYSAFLLATFAFQDFAIGTTQEAGVGTDDDSYFMTVNSSNELAIQHRRGGSTVSTTPQSEFAFDKLDGSGLSGFTLNKNGMNIYYIEFGHFGVLPPIFMVYGGMMCGWIPFHALDSIGLDKFLIVDDPLLPIRMKVTSDGSNDVEMFSGSWLGGVIGNRRERTANDQFSARATKTTGSGNTPLFTIRVLSNFKGKTNRIPIDIHSISAGVEGNKPHVVGLYKNSTITAPTYNPVNTSSVVEVDTVGTLAALGQFIREMDLGKSDGSSIEFEQGEIRLVAGETLTYVMSTLSASSDVEAAMAWDELK